MSAVLSLFLLTQDIPDHPDKLKYTELKFETPDPAAFRLQLPSGTPAYLLEDEALPIIEIRVYVRAGSFWNPPEKEGVAPLCGTLMRTGGTTSRKPEDLDEELDYLAADLSVSLGETYGSASLSILKKNLDKGLEILFDILRNPSFEQKQLDTLKASAMERLKARNDSTAEIESRETNRLFYGDFPLNRLPTGSSLNSIVREDLAAFHRKFIHPGNFVIAAAGAFQREDLVKKMEAALRDWPGDTIKPATIPKVTHHPEPAVYTFNKEGKSINQGRVTIGHLGIDIRHPDIQPVRLLSYIFGAGGFSSRLMQKVRTEEGLAYDVRSDFRPGPEYPFPFRMTLQSKSESCTYAVRLCLEELDRIRKEGVTEKELKDAIQFYLDGFPAFFFSTPFQTATIYAEAELLNYPKEYYQTYREKIARCTREDLRRVANDLLQPERFVFAFVGNIPAIAEGDGAHPVKLEEFGKVIPVPLPDPVTLERPKP